LSKTRIKVLGLLSLPLLAVAIAVLAFSFGHSATQSTEAASPEAVSMDLSIGNCSTSTNDTKCNGSAGNNFVVSIDFTGIPSTGYEAMQTQVTIGAGLTYNDPGDNSEFKFAGGLPVRVSGGGNVSHGDVYGSVVAPTPIFTVGPAINLSVNCVTGGTITLVPASGTNPGGSLYVDDNNKVQVPPSVSFSVNCPTATPVPPTDTPTPIPPTATPTDTPSAPGIIKAPALQNIFLTAQGTKIPPASCLGGTDGAVFTQSLSTSVTGTDKHGDPRDLGGFSFQVNYDETKVCVQIVPGQLASAWVSGGGSCIIFDSATKPSLQGNATIACNQLGKDDVSLGIGGDTTTLASIIVQPMPDEYSVMKPNNSNGNVVQIINKACKLTDQQGDPIPPVAGGLTCTDADVTIRYLEGDVVPDCVIDTLDTQAVAFRWGSQKGTLLFNDFFNNEPSKPQSDDDIDINDLQFVYGRFNSSCSGTQQPPQPPVNAKAA
jgi:hypothetical protein